MTILDNAFFVNIVDAGLSCSTNLSVRAVFTGGAGPQSQLALSKSVKLMVAASKWCLLCGSKAAGVGWVVICSLRLYKSLLYDDHSAYDLWSTERLPVKTATHKHVAWPPWLRCQFSYLIGYWAKSAELYLQQTLVEDGSLAAPAGLLTSNGLGEQGASVVGRWLS